MSEKQSTGRSTGVGVALAALALCGALTGCAEVAEAEGTSGTPPATIQELESHDEGVSEITLTERGAERLGLETDTVATGPDGGLQIPYSALIYDATGDTWVYTSPTPLVFVRAGVTVTTIDGDLVSLSAGPPVGTDIVTVAAAELFGAEHDTAH